MNDTRFEYENRPEPPVIFEPVGSDPVTTYTIDWENRPDHPPQAIKKLHTAQVKLAVAGNDLREDFTEEYDRALEAIANLLSAVTSYYVDDPGSEEWYNLHMGNLDELPGLTREVTYPDRDGETE